MTTKRKRKRDHRGNATPAGVNVNTSHRCYQVRLRKENGKVIQKTFRFDDQGLADATRALAAQAAARNATDEVIDAYGDILNAPRGEDGVSDAIRNLSRVLSE